MNNRKKSTLSYSILSGAISGSFSSIVFQPLEFIKTKLQQPEFAQNARLTTKNRNINLIIQSTMLDSNNQIRLLNGQKFWTGLTPSLLRAVPGAAFYFASIDYLRNTSILSHSESGGPNQLLHSLLIGVLSRSMADVATHPLNLVKTRYESENFNYKSILNALKSIFRQEGARGLFKGLVPTLIRDISYSGTYYPLYTKTKALVRDSGHFSKDQESAYFAICALISSTLTCALTQPPDMVRSYMQLSSKVDKNFLNSVKEIYTINGFKGFFAGFLPRSARKILMSVFSWTLYEKLSLRPNK